MAKSIILTAINYISSKFKYTFSIYSQQRRQDQLDTTILLYNHIIDACPEFFQEKESSLVMRFYESLLVGKKIPDVTKKIEKKKFPTFFLHFALPIINSSIKDTLDSDLIEGKTELPFYHRGFFIFPFLFQLKYYFFLNLCYFKECAKSRENKVFFYLNYLNFLRIVPDAYIFIEYTQLSLFHSYSTDSTDINKVISYLWLSSKEKEKIVEQWNETLSQLKAHCSNIVENSSISSQGGWSYHSHNPLQPLLELYERKIEKIHSECLEQASFLYFNSYVDFVSKTNYNFEWDANPIIQVLLIQSKKK